LAISESGAEWLSSEEDPYTAAVSGSREEAQPDADPTRLKGEAEVAIMLSLLRRK